MTTEKSANVIVIGGGVNGLWTAYHLAMQGVQTLLFEQFPYPHTRGSSHGQSRITRTSYEQPEYAELMPEAFRRWKDLEKEAQKELFVNTGLLTIYDMSRDEEKFYSMLDNLRKLEIRNYVVPGSSVARSFPGLSMESKHKAIFDAEAGILKADQCIQALRKLVIEKGVEIYEGEPVLSIKPVNEKKVIVKTSKGNYSSFSVVLTCGAYINKLLETVDLKIPVQPQRVSVTYWRDISEQHKYSISKNFPCICVFEKETHHYSIPSNEYPGLLKICSHFGTNCDPSIRDYKTPEIEENEKSQLDWLKKRIHDRYTDVDATDPAITEICMYTETSDAKFILDFHPKYKNVIIGSGFSGHGFKTSPSVGHILANMALGLQPPYPLQPFALNRFNQSKL